MYIERTHQEGCGRDDGGALYHAQSPQVVLAERERVAVVDTPHVLTAVGLYPRVVDVDALATWRTPPY